MTRVNCVPVETIVTVQLHAEYVEIPHVFEHSLRMVKAGRSAPVRPVPERYVMGPGHVAFFMSRLGYLENRYAEICHELRGRGYRLNPIFLRVRFAAIPEMHWKDWVPDDLDKAANMVRITQRLAERAQRKLTGERYGSWWK